MDVSDLDNQRVANRAGLLERPLNGFRWTRDYQPNPLAHPQESKFESTAALFLIPHVVGEGSSYEVQQYPAMKLARTSSIHRQFVRIAKIQKRMTRQEKLRAFANRYGFLGSPSEKLLLQWRASANDSFMPIEMFGESLRYWEKELFELATFVELWDLVAQEMRGEVAKHLLVTPRGIEINAGWDRGRLRVPGRKLGLDWRTIRWGDVDDKTSSGEVISGSWSSTTAKRTRRFRALEGRQPDLLLAAKLHILDRANSKIYGHVSPMFRTDEPPGDEMLLHPDSLLALMWLRFADEVTGMTAAGVACANPKCNRLIQPNGRQKYCDDNCKAKAFYQRTKAREGSSRTPTDTPTAPDLGGPGHPSKDASI